jgi:hypothetical protein
MRFTRQYHPPNCSAYCGPSFLAGGVGKTRDRVANALLCIAVVSMSIAKAQAQAVADRAFGFGSINATPQTPPATLLGAGGFQNQVSSGIVAAQSGPIAYVGNYGRVQEVNPTIPAAQSANAPVESGTINDITEFGGVRTFNVAFERLTVGDSFGLQTVDVCGVYWLTGGDKRPASSGSTLLIPDTVRTTHEFEITSVEAGHARELDNSSPTADDSPSPAALVSGIPTQTNGIALVYGLRSYSRRDGAGLDATGGILGRTSLRTTADNEVFAPQAGLTWLTTHGNWLFQAQGTALAGYNDGAVEQHSRIGEELIPGALNRPLFAQPVATDLLESHQAFSPGAEIRTEIRYFFTDAISLHLAWSGLLFQNMLMPNKIPDFRTTFLNPDFILEDAGDQHLFTQDLYCGIEYLR